MKKFYLPLLLASITAPGLIAQSTPKGTNLGPYLFTYSYSQADLAANDSYVQNNFSNITIIENSTNDYNCHGWAWLYSEGGARIAINTPGDDAFWNDGSYYQTSSTSGEKISYPGDHSAIQAGGGYFISKWGAGPRVQHTPYNVPSIYLNGSTNLNYYDCNFAPQLLTARVDYGTTYDASGIVVIPTSAGSHTLYVDGLYSPSYSFTGLDPSVSVTSQGYLQCNFYFSGSPSGRINISMSNSCASTSTFIVISSQSGGRLAVYPNPADGETNVGIQDDLDHKHNRKIKTIKNLYLYDENNNMIQDYSSEARTAWLKVNTASWKKGIYYVKAIYEDGSSEVKRVQVGSR
jgi:hypothetical protein